ncbi:MAG: hypothetical protein OCD76_23770 [Reichenbachiella sp.]
MLTKFPLLIFILLSVQVSFGQTPPWVDYATREVNYPSDKYLTGYQSSEEVDYSDELIDRLINTAKVDLIESILIDLSSKSTVDTETTNGDTDTNFKNRTQSLAQAKIVGLNTEHSYDKRKKRAYAFAFALRTDVIKYYKSYISITTTDLQLEIVNISKYQNSNNLDEALHSLFGVYDALLNLKQAQNILVALGNNNREVLKLDQVNKLDQSAKEIGNSILDSPELSVKNLTQYLAYKISLYNIKESQKIYLEKTLYRPYNLSTHFATALDNNLTENLRQRGLNVSATKFDSDFILTNDYSEIKDVVNTVTTLLTKVSKEKYGVVNGHITTSWLDKNSLAYLPDPVRKMKLLSELSLNPNPKIINCIFNQPLDQQLRVNIEDRTGQPIGNIPFNYQHKNNAGIKGSAKSNTEGVVKFELEKVQLPKKMQFINVSIDAPTYLNLPEDDALYQSLLAEYALPNCNFILKVSGLALYLDVTETLLGESYQDNLVSNKLKQTFTELGFKFIDNPDESDYYMEVSVSSNQGGEYEGLYFALANVTINMVSMDSGDEIFSQTFLKIKGGGGNYRNAAYQAYNKAAIQVAEEIKEKFE